MSSPNHSTSDIEDAFSSMNILNYTSVSSDYFPASSGSISFNSSENSNIIPSVISPFYNNPCLKDVQAFYAKESPISPQDPITPPAILTPSPPSGCINVCMASASNPQQEHTISYWKLLYSGKRENYKEVYQLSTFYFNVTERSSRLISMVERTESVFSEADVMEENNVHLLLVL
ncbi:hypothetical protein Tco_0632431 [Tanacetum coccineum]